MRRRRIKRPERNVYVILDVPELSFIPPTDRECTNRSPRGALTNKIFKYKHDAEGRMVYAHVVDRYGIDNLVRPRILGASGSIEYSKGGKESHYVLHDANKLAKGKLF